MSRGEADGSVLGDGAAGATEDFRGYEVQHSELLVDAPIIAVRRDTIATPTGSARREIVEHFSAVAIAAVRDGKVLMIRQYRHGVGRYLWEVPAGLMDVAGEDPLDTARRELAEEGGLAAQTWHVLGDLVTSPGFSEEMVRIFKAEDLSEDVSGIDVQAPEDEEADMIKRWVPLEQAVAWVQDGTVINSAAVAAILHLAAGTQRSVEQPYTFHSSMAQRRAPLVKCGEDMKFVRGGAGDGVAGQQ